MIKFEGAERDIILGYIFERKLQALDDKFIIVQSMRASSDARIEYENMPQNRKLCIYRKIVDSKIMDLIYDEAYNHSLFMYFVNGSPGKRKKRIREWAFYRVKNMPCEEKKEFYSKLGLKFYDE